MTPVETGEGAGDEGGAAGEELTGAGADDEAAASVGEETEAGGSA